MRAEKIAGDLGEAYELVGGERLAAAGSRRRWRAGWSARRPTCRACSTAPSRRSTPRSTSWRRRGAGSRRRSRSCEFDPHELERAEERLFALRAAARKYQVRGRRPAGDGRAHCPPPRRDRPRRRSGSRALEKAAAEALAALREAPRARCRSGAPRRRRRWRRRSTPSCRR